MRGSKNLFNWGEHRKGANTSLLLTLSKSPLLIIPRKWPRKILEGGPDTPPPLPPSSDWTHKFTNRQLSTRGIQIYSFYRDPHVPSRRYAYWRLLGCCCFFPVKYLFGRGSTCTYGNYNMSLWGLFLNKHASKGGKIGCPHANPPLSPANKCQQA